jgi:hypothetical protein
MNGLSVINEENIKNKIFTIRGMQVMLDRDLAELYEVETKVFNQAVKRNENRFPDDFRFQLTNTEKNELVTNCDRFNTQNSLRSQSVTLESSRGKHTKYLPYAFTEQGVSMLSAVLKSDIAVDISVKIIRSFVNMRKFISNNALIFQRLETLEQKQFSNDEKFNKLFEAIEAKSLKPTQGIFYDGEVYDAYLFISNLIKSAKESIVLVDNYIDESVLTLLLKRQADVTAAIYTKNITAQLELDIKKHNAQYPKITLKKFDASHDRFLILDGKELYHIGASLKDLGKKWFAFSKFDMKSFDILKRLEG